MQVTQAAKNLAERLGIELNGLKGSGKGGQITKADVVAIAQQPLPLVRLSPGDLATVLAERAAMQRAEVQLRMMRRAYQALWNNIGVKYRLPDAIRFVDTTGEVFAQEKQER